jgi:hypothetical protein
MLTGYLNVPQLLALIGWREFEDLLENTKTRPILRRSDLTYVYTDNVTCKLTWQDGDFLIHHPIRGLTITLKRAYLDTEKLWFSPDQVKIIIEAINHRPYMPPPEPEKATWSTERSEPSEQLKRIVMGVIGVAVTGIVVWRVYRRITEYRY